MATKRLEERFGFSGGKVDRTGPYPVVRGVLLCGPTSANRRRYRREAFAGDRVKRYDNRPVFLNHGKGGESRDYQDKVATIENARHRDDGMPVGDLAVNPKHPFAEAFLFDAEHKPGACGMSHVAHCQTAHAADGWEDVTEMVEAESVDVVVGPATTKGLFESKGAGVFTFKKLAEWVAKHPKATSKQALKAKKLGEDLDGMGGGMADMAAAPEEPAADADPDEAITAGFKAAFDAIRDKLFDGSMDKKTAFKKLSAIFDGHSDATDAADTGGDTGGSSDDSAKEGKKPALDAVLSECTKAGIKNVRPTLLKTLMRTPEAAERAELIREDLERTAPPAERPTSGGRNPAPGATGGGGKPSTEVKVPTDGKAFAESVRR